MLRRITFLVLLVVLLGVPGLATAQEKSYQADRFDAAATALPDGSLVVRESVTFRFSGGPFSYVFREIPIGRTDGIVDIVASVDGVVWPEGTMPGQVEITRGGPVRVEWHLSPTSDEVHTYELSYRMLGVAFQGEDGRDILRWQPLPDDFEYEIREGRFSLSYPAAAQPIGQPVVVAGRANADQSDGTIIFTATAIEPDDTLVVEQSFRQDTLINAPPAWQAQIQRQNSLRWYWVAAAVGALGLGLVGLWAAVRSYLRPTPSAESPSRLPPDGLSPAIAGLLAAPASGPTWAHAMGALYDLAGRGYISMTEIPSTAWYKGRDFELTLLERTSDLRPHEKALLDLLFTDKDGRAHQSIRVSKIASLITSSRWKLFKEAIQAETKAMGYLDRDRKDAGKRTLVIGVVLMLSSLVLLIVAVMLYGTYGGWPLLIPVAVFALGVAWMSGSLVVSPLSDRGAQVAAAWEPFRRYLKDASRGKVAIDDMSQFERYLPYAAAYGLADPWVRRFNKLGYRATPGYFNALSAADDGSYMPIFIALIVANNASGGSVAGSAGAGAAGGAAGGGASGAG